MNEIGRLVFFALPSTIPLQGTRPREVKVLLTVDREPELDTLLNDLRGEGELDSTGTFAVDFLEAQRKLGQYQLARPGEGLLKVIQACVAGAAAKITLSNRLSRVTLRANARFDPEELRRLSQYLLHAHVEGPRSLHHLAVGINALVAARPKKLTLRYGNLLWTPGKEWSEVAGEPSELQLDYVRSQNSRFNWSRFGEALAVPLSQVSHYLRRAGQADLDEVSLRTVFAPIPITLNRVLLNTPSLESLFPPKRHILQLEIIARSGSAAQLIGIPLKRKARLPEQIWAPSLYSLPAPSLKLAEQPRAITVHESEGKLALAHGLILFLADAPTRKAALLFVQDGVTLKLKQADLGFPGVVCILSAHGLKTDLSGFDLLEDEKYRELIGRLKMQVRDLVEHVRGKLGSASWYDRATWGSTFLDSNRASRP